MSTRGFVPTFLIVGASAAVGWFWRIAQDHGVPFLIRTPIGVLALIGIGVWLGRRLTDSRHPSRDYSEDL